MRSSIDCADIAILSFSRVGVPPGGFNGVESIDTDHYFVLSYLSLAYTTTT